MVPNLATHPISCLYFLLRSISIVRNISSYNCKYYLKIEQALYINVKNLICTHNKIIQFSLFHCNFCGRSSLTELQPQPCNIFTKDALAQVFSCEFCEIRNITFFTEHLRWLFLLQSPCGHFLHRLKYIVFFFFKTVTSFVLSRKNILVVISIFSQFAPICAPQKIQNTPLQVLRRLLDQYYQR